MASTGLPAASVAPSTVTVGSSPAAEPRAKCSVSTEAASTTGSDPSRTRSCTCTFSSPDCVPSGPNVGGTGGFTGSPVGTLGESGSSGSSGPCGVSVGICGATNR